MSDPYADVICDPCPRCKAEPGIRCTNPTTGTTAHAPGVARTKETPCSG